MRLLVVDHLVLYHLHWGVVERLVADHGVEALVVGSEEIDVPDVHRVAGWVDPRSSAIPFLPMPGGSRAARVRAYGRLVAEHRADAVLLGPEPLYPSVLEALAALVPRRRVRVVCGAMENLVTLPRGWKGTSMRLLWRRIDGLAAAASVAIDSYRAAGLPRTTTAVPLVAGVAGPPAGLEPLPAHAAALTVGFVGRLVPEKGVDVLAATVDSLPADIRLRVVGDGPLRPLLESLGSRVELLGLQPHDAVWRALAACDCLVLPSRSTPGWREQFGYVLGEAMALGLPCVGSDSGAIPEVIGPAGIVVPEGDEVALAQALRRLADDPALRSRLAEVARERFRTEFSLDACARKLALLLGA